MAESKVVDLAALNKYTELSAFRLADGIQVRGEKFGLLFYNYRGPRIYFLSSRDLIGDDFFDGKHTIGQLVDSIRKEYGLPREKIRDGLETIFRTLETKGLIDGQSLR